jgi:hypothetical protein
LALVVIGGDALFEIRVFLNLSLQQLKIVATRNTTTAILVSGSDDTCSSL